MHLRCLERLEQTIPVLVAGYPKPVTARVGDNVELECLEEPNPKTTHYEWLKTNSLDDITGLYKKGSGKLSPMKYKPYTVDGDKARFNGVKLQLTHITKEDEGFYSCFLSNSDGMTHGSTFLNVTPVSRTGNVKKENICLWVNAVRILQSTFYPFHILSSQSTFYSPDYILAPFHVLSSQSTSYLPVYILSPQSKFHHSSVFHSL